MSSPLIAIIVFVVIDFIFSQFTKKDEETIKSPQKARPQKQSKGFLEMLKDLEKNISLELEDKKPIAKSKPDLVKPAESMEAKVLRKQKTSNDKRVVLEKKRIGDRKKMMQGTRLSEQVNINNSNKSLMDDYDLDQRREVSIKTSQAINVEKQVNVSTEFNIKNDILKAIVYAEILSEPKSLKRK